MPDQVEEIQDDIIEVVEKVAEIGHETVSEVEAQIAVAKAEAKVEQATEAVEIIQQTANLQVAQVALEAEQAVAQHIEKVEHIEEKQEWQEISNQEMWRAISDLTIQVEKLTSQQSTPLQSETMPPTLEIVTENQNSQSADGADPLQETIAEIVEEVRPTQKRTIKVL